MRQNRNSNSSDRVVIEPLTIKIDWSGLEAFNAALVAVGAHAEAVAAAMSLASSTLAPAVETQGPPKQQPPPARAVPATRTLELPAAPLDRTKRQIDLE